MTEPIERGAAGAAGAASPSGAAGAASAAGASTTASAPSAASAASASAAPIRRYAERLVCGATLADKLAPPPSFEELGPEGLLDPGEPWVVQAPGRPPELTIVPGRAGRVPPIVGMRDRFQRARILHALANHELQAIELFAWALLAFPDAPEPFRRGLVAILADEQRHLGLYLDRMRAHGTAFGDHPVTGHFWHKLDHFRSPLRFCCAMGLTFENANLDFAREYAEAARAAGDLATAEVLELVHEDEISHVRFGWVWMRKLAGDDADPWRTFVDHLEWPLSPARARGKTFSAEARRRAGLDPRFIDALEHVEALQPSGARR